MNSTSKQLNRIRYLFLNKIVETKAKKNFNNSINILGKNVGPFSVGNHYKLEYWISQIFVKNDILEFTKDFDLDIQKIQKIAFSESRSTQINKVGNDLFTAIREHLKILNYQNQKGIIPDRTLRSFVSNVQDLITVRHRKILNLSQTRQTVKLTQNLTAEEKILVENMTKNINEWKNFYLNNKKKK